MDLSIGQMARINHISIQTLRLYDKMGAAKAGSSRCRIQVTGITVSFSVPSWI